MKYTITPPERINTSVNLPASKSISNRALVIHALTPGSPLPDNLSDCDDTDVIVKALEDMPYEINIKAAGTAMRFMTAFLSTQDGEHVITGTERMLHRPIKVLVDALRFLGADIEYVGEEGFPPLRIKGKKIEGGAIDIPSNVSSQYISALLLVGSTFKKGLDLHLVGDIISRPYIDLTLCMMRDFGADAQWEDENTIHVKPQPYTARPYFIENDWSGASYWYEIAALAKTKETQIELEGLLDGSKQGDSIIKYMFNMLSVKTTFERTDGNAPTSVHLKPFPLTLPRFDYDFSNQPDMAQTLVVACAALGIPFNFTGLQTLRIKETDRIAALENELRKLGIVLHDKNDNCLYWDGETCEPDEEPVIDTYEDHRMAMAFAPICLRNGKITINNPEVVSKSYPHFWEDLKKAGFKIEEKN